jgi:hypothetical protein
VTPDPVLAIITRLKALTTVTAITGTRIYDVGSVPTNPTTPYIVVADISDIGDAPTNTSDAGHAVIQCSCFASTDKGARDLSQTLKKRVPGEDAILPCGTDFLRVTSIDDAGHTPDVSEGSPIQIWIRHRDFRIYYTY